jgi:HAD superfamily hydrolase (TIGR01484 family)
MIFKPKLLAFDLDGTLAESKQRVTAEMGELLSQLLARMPVAIMSGAGFPQFEVQFLPAFPSNSHFERLYLFATSAARCFTYHDGTWKAYYDHSFTTIERSRIMQALKESLEEIPLTKPPHLWGEQVEDRGAQITYSALGQQAPVEAKEEWNKKYDAERTKLQEALIRHLPDFSVKKGGLTTIDITHKGINKAYGIRKLIELTGISVAEMLYVGDALEEGGNDSVVIETGIKTHEVFGPEETAALIKNILQNTSV